MPDNARGGGRRQGQQGSSRAVVASGAQQQQEVSGAQRALVAVTKEIDNRLAIIGASSAAGIKPDRLKLVALTAFTRTPALWTCDPVSVARAIVEAGQLGLEPTGLMGGAYLVPRANQATLLVGYRGLVMLARRSGEVQRVEARVVRAKDAFEYGYGDDPYIRHTPSRDPDPGPYTDAYAIIFYRDGSKQFDVMSIAEIEAIRARSSSPNAGPWVSDYAEMCKKTPLRRLMKMAPLTLEAREFIEAHDPEVDEAPAGTPTSSRQAELRAQLQRQMDAEYGGQPITEGEVREPAPTTRATGAGTPDGQAQPASEGATGSAPSEAANAQQAAPAADPPADAAPPAAKSQPERVSQVLAATCGISHEGLGVGPCALPAGHTEGPWRDASGNDQPPQNEHEDAGGMRWTMPRQK